MASPEQSTGVGADSNDQLGGLPDELPDDSPGGLVESAELILTLRDIHLPEPVSAWPLSPLAGWMIVGLLMAIACLSGLFWRRRRMNNPIAQALREHDSVFSQWKKTGSAAQYLEHSGIIIKRLALHLTKQTDTARMTGGEWVQWMNTRSDRPLTPQTQAALTQERYKRAPDTDISTLHQSLSHWIKHCEQIYRA